MRVSRSGNLQITLIASWFNYINRVVDALGEMATDPIQERLSKLNANAMALPL
jgi:hypothetical protein